jgi:hypothetical protein
MKKGLFALITMILLGLSLPLQACQSASGDNYEVLSLDVVPGKVLVNEKFTVTANINNASSGEARYTVPVMINGTADERDTVTIEPGKSQKIQFTLSRGKPGTYEIVVGNKNAMVKVEEAAPAAFKLSEFNISTNEATPGEEIVVTTRIANTGGSEGTYIAEVSVNGKVEQSEKTVIAPGVNYTCVFKLTKNDPGTYAVAIGDLTGNFSVVKPIQTIQVTTPVCPPQKPGSQRSSCCP